LASPFVIYVGSCAAPVRTDPAGRKICDPRCSSRGSIRCSSWWLMA